MKRLTCAVLVALGLVVTASMPSEAHDGDRRDRHREWREERRAEWRESHRWGGPRIFVGFGPAVSWGPAYAYAPPPPSFWYFCRSYGAYYPNVPSCPEPWVAVPTR